ncbi:MAG: ATP-binding protein [Desulfobacter sp.]
MEKELYNSLVLDTYVRLIKAKYPDILIDDLMEYAGIENYEIGDSSVWFTQTQMNRFHEKLSMISDNLKISREAGQFAADPKCLGELRGMILSLGGICNAFKFMGKYARRLNRSSTYTTRKIARNKIEVIVTPHKGVSEKKFQCENRRGNFRGIADLFLHNDITIDHPECIFTGGRCCRYVISWQETLFSLFNRLKWLSGFLILGLFIFWLTPWGDGVPHAALAGALIAFLLIGWGTEKAKTSRLASSLSDIYQNKEELLKQMDINAENSRVIIEIGQALRMERPDKDMFDRIAEITGQRLKYDRVMVMIANDDRTELIYRGGSGLSPREQTYLERYRISLKQPSEGVFYESFTRGKAILVNDMDLLRQKSTPRSFRLAEVMNPLTFISCPISFEDTVVGIIVAGNVNTPKKMGRNDKNLMMGVAQQIGGAYHKQKLEAEYEAFNKQLSQIQRIEALGVLAGGIAHDFNNILSPIVGYTDLCISMSRENGNIINYLERIKKASKRAKELVRQILAFSHRGEQEFIRFSVVPVVNEALQLMRASMPATIGIKTHIDPELKPVLADPTMIHQIIMNLCTNAYHAMKDQGGTMTVDIAQETVLSGGFMESLHLPAGTYARLSVADTGCGMPPEIMEKIFEPYFTTKEKGKGTGLGLSITHNIIRQLKGHIEVDSTPSQGTRFDVYIPQVETEPAEDHAGQESAVPGGREKIMVVDDERSILTMLEDVLEDKGYRVTSYQDSHAALEAFHSHPRDVDLVITDMTMPGLTGLALSRKMMEKRADIPIILCTGHSTGIDEAKASAAGIKAFFMKPIIIGELTAAVRNALDAARRKTTES